MGTLAPEVLELVAARFRILGDPVRLRLLQRLHRETSVGELALEIGTTQPNVSKHLKVLLDAGMVARRQEGNVAYYAIADESVFELCDLVCERLRDRFEQQAKALMTASAPPRARAGKKKRKAIPR
jgi:DNA-binding transcriptional ArsR family regulator